jgi:endonuclease/exonuclease/phosphatase family metal-dependent hydrolase
MTVETGANAVEKQLLAHAPDFHAVAASKPYEVDGTLQGQAILYRTSRFELLHRDSKVLAKSNCVAVLALLKDRQTGTSFWVAVLHLKSWPSNGPSYKQLRKQQVGEFIAWFRTLDKQRPGHPLLVTGDFNEPMHLGSGGCVPHLASELRLGNVFADAKHLHPLNTTIIDDTWLVDYVLATSDDGRMRGANPVATTQQRYTYRPDKVTDHLPLCFELQLSSQ